MAGRAVLRVGIETARRRSFASALDWPGWSRAGKTEEAALEALVSSAPRYALVARRAGLAFPQSAGSEVEVEVEVEMEVEVEVEVVERAPGDATTEFGAPSVIFTEDRLALSAGELERLARILPAAWATLADVVASAPAELRKGPRGGGRDRDAIAAHVAAAEVAYARKAGLPKRQVPEPDAAALAELRRDLLASLVARAGEKTADPATGDGSGEADPRPAGPLRPGTWPVRYAARRITWHVLDHAWEIEDRSSPSR